MSTAQPHDETTYDYEYRDQTDSTNDNDVSSSSLNVLDIILVVVSVVIFLLGICGNGLVIWLTGFKMKKTVNTTWYLSLAISDFLFCAFLPFNITYDLTSDWIFGVFMCKFTSFVLFLNMFSSIFLLVIISVDRLVVVMLAVWAQNHRSLKRASLTVVFAWVIAMALSLPSAVFRNTSEEDKKMKCYNDYSINYRINVSVIRFISGFVMPLVIIATCYKVITVRLRTNRMARSTKPFKVMTALIATFIICWLPYHVFILLKIKFDHSSIAAEGLKISTMVLSANSFLNPFLYAFMGKDVKAKFWSSFVPKIENAFEEEGQLDNSKKTSISNANSTTV